MGRNVLLLYMSLFSFPSRNPNIRAQTNEAAVLKLKEYKEGPDCILALCSKQVCESKTVTKDNTTYTTLEYFRDKFLDRIKIPAERLVVIPVPDSMDSTAQFHAISELLEKIEPEDTLSIDLSGGMRDTAMLLVAAARCMRDLRGVDTRRVIYSELLYGGGTKVHDSSMLYNLFDLITAMDEFFSTGTARKLRSYLWSEGECDPALHTLLARINQFSDDLALCRVQALNNDLEQIRQALQPSPQESQTLTGLFFHLLKDRFGTEFAGLLRPAEDNLPALVRWCADHGMYQQALTLLCEEMPAYVCRHLFVQPTKEGLDYMKSQPKNEGKAWAYPLFHYHLCCLMLLQTKHANVQDLRVLRSKAENDGNVLSRIATTAEMNDYLDMALASRQLELDPNVRPQISQAAICYQKILQYRNQINHANDNAANLLVDGILPLDAEHIQQTLQDAADYLTEIRPLHPNAPADVTPLLVTDAIPARN